DPDRVGVLMRAWAAARLRHWSSLLRCWVGLLLFFAISLRYLLVRELRCEAINRYFFSALLTTVYSPSTGILRVACPGPLPLLLPAVPSVSYPSAIRCS